MVVLLVVAVAIVETIVIVTATNNIFNFCPRRLGGKNCYNGFYQMIYFFLFLVLFSFIFTSPVFAQCPVCIVTVGGGMLLAQKLGIDDFLVSIWISALNTAISFWLAPKLKIKFFKNPYIFSLILFAFTLFYFQFTGQIGFKDNQILGLDKIVFGQTLGLVIMFLAVLLDKFIRSKNNDKVLFYYQKVIIPVSFLLITTFAFKFIFNL